MIHISKCLILAHSIPYSDFNTDSRARSKIYFWTSGQHFNPLQKWPLTSGIFRCDIKIKNLLLTSFSNFWSILPRFLCYRIHIIATCKENRGTAFRALWRVRNDNSSPQIPPFCSLWMGTRLPGRCLCLGVYRALPEPCDYYRWTAIYNTGCCTRKQSWNTRRGCKANRWDRGSWSKSTQWWSLDLDL